MLFPVHKTLRSSTERLEEHRKENKETEKEKEKKDRERKKKQCLACSLVMQCTTIFPSGFILFFFFLLSYATWHSIIRGILRWKHCRKVAFVVLFLFFFVFSLFCSPSSRYLYAEAPSENEVEQRPLSFLFLSPSPLSPPLFLSFLSVRLFFHRFFSDTI